MLSPAARSRRFPTSLAGVPLAAVPAGQREHTADWGLAAPENRPGIAGVAYDTAWLAGVPAAADRGVSRFPTSLRWLADHQLSDGSWGSSVRYEHDRVLCTLAALAPLAQFGRRDDDRRAVEAGTRYLWQHGHLLGHEPIELVGFELLLPTLVERASAAGVAVPPHLDVYQAERTRKLNLLPAEMLYSSNTTAVHSLEFLGQQADTARLRDAQGHNGSVGNSPAATAYLLSHFDDPRAADYLARCLDWTGGATAPVLHPCETFELLWSAYHLFLGGAPVHKLLTRAERAHLREALANGGVSLSPSFPIADADDTAVGLLLLHEVGERVDPGVLRAFEGQDGTFVSFPYERHSSVGVNLHVLHALLGVPGYSGAVRAIGRIVDYLADQHSGLYWIDKWHISPMYATAHAIHVLDQLPEHPIQHVVQHSKEWLRQSQNGDGSWGFYGQPTAEETAYGLLALTSKFEERDRARCQAASASLNFTRHDDFPPLWIDKCLYTPPLIVRAAIDAAVNAWNRIERSSHV
jgi:halimadienyl-diphosphate synthase